MRNACWPRASNSAGWPSRDRPEDTIAPPERRYSDQEFALILRKAFEIQDRPGAGTGAGAGESEGLSLPDIQAIAREVGLDPATVEQAAALTRSQGGVLVRVLGAPTTYELMHTAEGEVGRDDFAPLVEIIRRAAAHQGEVTEQLGSLEWNTVGEPSQIHVTVSPRDGRTSVRIFADRGPAGILTFLLPGVAGLLAIGIGGAILEPSTVAGVGSLIAASLGGAWVAGRTIWKNTTKGFQQRLGRLQDALAQAVDRCAEPAAPTDPKR